MKTTVDFLQNIAPTSKRFEKNVLALLPEETKEVWISSVGMERANGSGSYNFVLDIEINKCKMSLKVHTNASYVWDAYKDIEYKSRANDNWNKATTLMILENKKEYIVELLTEEN